MQQILSSDDFIVSNEDFENTQASNESLNHYVEGLRQSDPWLFLPDPRKNRHRRAVFGVARVVRRRQNTRRQPKASKGASNNSAKKSGDSGDDSGDPDPEPPHVVYYNYKSFARLFNLAEQTLRNRVANGTFPPPLKTAFGPRFTQSHIDFALNPVAKIQSKTNKVGRPRIAQQSKGGAA